MSSHHLHISRIEGILNQKLGPLYCQCKILDDASILISVYEPIHHACRLMIAGVSTRSCQSEDSVQRLAESIQNDLDAVHLHH